MATLTPQNQAAFTVPEIIEATGARALGPLEARIVGVSTDTRTLKAGNLYIALRGEHFDGHAYVDAAIRAGATAVIVDREVSASSACVLVVPDTLVALGAIAHAYRERLEREHALRWVIGITGSVGKTTTKEMCSAVLEGIGERVHRTPGNLNNRIGLPLTVLSADASTTALVLEMGMNEPGEIAALATIARPNVGIVTSVAAVHTEGVGSIENVAKEKGSLLTALSANGAAIFTVDDRNLQPFVVASAAHLKIGTGRHEDASARLVERQMTLDGRTRIRVAFAASLGVLPELTLSLASPGDGAAKNACCALGLATIVSRSRLADAAKALESLTPGAGRGMGVEGVDGTLLLDDAYNASRRSIVNALEIAAELAQTRKGRIVAVLGDMLELGAYEEEEHLRVGETVARVGVSLFVACGKRMRVAADEARELGADFVVEESDPMEAVAHVLDFIQPADVIVVKGSRSMKMERVVDALRKKSESRPTDEAMMSNAPFGDDAVESEDA
jgi:UDP-N-acetylmuramoyl-tripeptide--D-alanyl-D-alanine ligase